MKIELAQALIERGILASNSRIYARCPIIAMGDAPASAVLQLTVDRVIAEEGTIKLHCHNKSGRRYSVPCEEVDNIDGMSPERLAAAYDIRPNGLVKMPGKKRGRKPKALLNS
jgi:hypothetical protein